MPKYITDDEKSQLIRDAGYTMMYSLYRGAEVLRAYDDYIYYIDTALHSTQLVPVRIKKVGTVLVPVYLN